MSTLDLPDPETSPMFGQPVPDPAAPPAAPPPALPEVSAEVPDGPDGLPRSGSACRWCGQQAGPDALTVGGTVRQPESDPVPPDATSQRRVMIRTPAMMERAAFDRAAGKPPYMVGAVMREVVTPVWRCCDRCAELPAHPDAVDLLRAALGGPALTPTLLHVASIHAPRPFYATGGRPTDRGHREPWLHMRDELADARALLASLEQAGGVPAPDGRGCAVCGRSNSPYGWSDRRWFPASGVPHIPSDGLLTCDGWRTEPGQHRRRTRWDTGPQRRRVGCRRLVDQPAIAGPLVERTYAAAMLAGAQAPHWHHVAPEHRGGIFAASHPDFAAPDGPRPPWWHVADIPTLPVEPDPAELAERLAALEAKLTGVS